MGTTKSTSEKGHAKNVATFQKLVSFAVAFPGYNPSNPALAPSALKDLVHAATVTIDKVSDAGGNYKASVDDRYLAFVPMSKMVTRIGKALGASPDITSENKETYTGLARKYRGARKEAEQQVPATPPAGTPPEQISVAQLSYDSRVAHFKNIKSFLSALPTYNSNEPELSLNGISDTASTLEATNQKVIDAISSLANCRADRDTILYAKESGLVDVAYKLKDYVSSKYESSSPYWKQIRNLSFSRK